MARDQITQHDPKSTTGRTRVGTDLPELAEWLDGVASLRSIGQQRAAVKALIPHLVNQADDVRRAWLAAVLAAGWYSSPAYLARLVDQAVTAQADELADVDQADQRTNAGQAVEVPGTTNAADQPERDLRELAGTTFRGEPMPAVPAGERDVPGMKDRWTYEPGVAVRVRGRDVLPWCPVVTRKLVTRAGLTGKANDVRLTITVGADTDTIGMAELANGEAWLTRFPSAAGGSTRDMREVLASIVRDQAEHLPEVPTKPRWENGRLVLPPADALETPGYFEISGEWREWCHLVERTKDAPKVALMLALSVAGIFVKAIDGQSVLVHANGNSSAGKGTAIKVAASAFGNPRQLIRPWGSTPKGVLSYLRETEFLTAFRDELGANARLTAGDALEELVFTVAEGAERDMSSRTGGYRRPAGSWHGTLISTGNVSIFSRVANQAMWARVIEVESPLTKSAAQSDAFQDLAHAHYGHAIHKIAEHGFSPADFDENSRKAVKLLSIPDGNGVVVRYGEHLAYAIAGAWLLEDLCGVTGFTETVLTLCREMLADAITGLKEHGMGPYDQLWAIVNEAWAARPDLVMNRGEYQTALLRGDRVEVNGWDLTEDGRIAADIAMLPNRLRAIINEAGLTDLQIALRDGMQRGLVVSNKRGELKYNLPVGSKRIGTYALKAVPEEREDPGYGSDTTPVTGPVTDEVTAADQASYGSYGLPANEVFRRVAPKRDWDGDIAACGGDPERLADLGFAALDAAPEDDALHEQIRAAWRAAKDAVRASQIHADGTNTRTEGACTREGASTPGGAQDAGGAVVLTSEGMPADWDSADELQDWTRWLTGQREVGNLPAAGPSPEGSLAAWHAATGGARWVDFPGRTGVSALSWLAARHHNISLPALVQNPIVDEISRGNDLRVRFDYVRSESLPEVGETLVVMDVEAQFLGGMSHVQCGDGEPVVFERFRSYAQFLKMPGYLRLSRDLVVDHPAFEGMKAGAILTTPAVAYLQAIGAEMAFDNAVVWEKHGTRLKAWADIFRPARQSNLDKNDPMQRVVKAAVKDVYSSFGGGMLRSEKWNKNYRLDWSDMLVSVVGVNALRAVDKARYGLPHDAKPAAVAAARKAGDVKQLDLGMCKDSAWFVLGHDAEPVAPQGLLVSPQPGKWKLEKHCTVTTEIVAAIGSGSPHAVRDAINAACKEQGGE